MFRSSPTTAEGLVSLLREIDDRFVRLENGGAIAGEISLGTTIHVGGLELKVTDAGGGHRNLTFRNPVNNLTFVISL